MKAKIDKTISVLRGNSLWAFRRTADLAVFHFGDKQKVKTFHDEIAEVGKYSLHVQCAWRVSHGDKVITGSGDLHDPPGIQSEPDPSFDWKKHPNRVDELMESLFQHGTRQLAVQSVEARLGAGVCVQLDNGFSLEIFPDNSAVNEYWRFLQPGTDEPHFVLTGNGIEIPRVP